MGNEENWQKTRNLWNGRKQEVCDVVGKGQIVKEWSVVSVECAEGVLVVIYSLHTQKGLPHHSLPLSHHSLPLIYHSLPLSHCSLPLSHHSLPLSHHSLPLMKVSGHQHSITAPTHTLLNLKYSHSTHRLCEHIHIVE